MDWLIIQDNNTQLQKQEEDTSSLLLDIINQKLNDKDLWNVYEFLAENLIDVVINAKSPDVKWQLHKDYWEVNRALWTLHKIINPKVWQKNINIWFFTPPVWPLKH